MNENLITIGQIITVGIWIGPIGPMGMVFWVVRQVIVIWIRDIEAFIPIVVAVVINAIE